VVVTRQVLLVRTMVRANLTGVVLFLLCPHPVDPLLLMALLLPALILPMLVETSLFRSVFIEPLLLLAFVFSMCFEPSLFGQPLLAVPFRNTVVLCIDLLQLAC
jgi:hypothetical protein